MKTILLALVLLCGASPVWAQYTSAVIATAPDVYDSGALHWVVVFSGQGEIDRKVAVDIAAGNFDVTAALAAELRRIALTLNVTKGKDAVLPTVGATFDVKPLVVVPPPPPPPPTDEQKARTQFDTDYHKLTMLKPYADLGIPAAVTAYADLLAKVSMEFLLTYVIGQ